MAGAFGFLTILLTSTKWLIAIKQEGMMKKLIKEIIELVRTATPLQLTAVFVILFAEILAFAVLLGLLTAIIGGFIG